LNYVYVTEVGCLKILGWNKKAKGRFVKTMFDYIFFSAEA